MEITVGNPVQVELLHSVDWKFMRCGHWVGRRNNYENGQSDDQVVGQVAAEEFRYAFHLVEPHFPVRFGRSKAPNSAKQQRVSQVSRPRK